MRVSSGRPPQHGGNVLVFQRKGHGCTPSGAGRACMAASASEVIPLFPRSIAKSTSSVQNSEGILFRPRQFDTRVGAIWSACATSSVPPNVSMTKSGVMTAGIFTFCEAVKPHALAIAPAEMAWDDQAMAKRYAQIGKRLIALREALGISQAELCRQIKCQANRWNQYETGERRITIPIAMRLADAYGASMDWVYRGETRTLTQELFAKLAHAA